MRYKNNKWYKFDEHKGYRQALPPEYKLVLVAYEEVKSMFPEAIVVGYLHYAAGCKDSPYFVTPGVALYHKHRKVVAWNDCVDLADDIFLQLIKTLK